MFGKKTAQALDTTAAKAHQTGQAIAGDTGGRIADALVNATIAPIRDRIDHTCTHADCNHS